MFSNLDDATVTQLVVSLATIFLVYGIYRIFAFIYDEVTSPLSYVPGPPSPGFIYGNFKQLSESNNFELFEDWINQYGTVIQFKDMLGVSRLLTTDVKAINHILFNSYDFPRPDELSYVFRKLFGLGLLAVEGDVHKNQRKILNPAFGPQQIRELTEIFIEKALELRDIWRAEIDKQDGVGHIDCLSWMSRTTLDIIGLACFNYKFNALSSDPEKNELMKSLSAIFKAGAKPDVIGMLKAMYPPLRFLPAPNDIEKNKASTVMRRIAADLLKQSKASQEKDKNRKSSSRKDIFSLLVQANTMPDLPEAQRLSDGDVMAQIPSFLIAGHQPTSIAMSWALYALTQHKDVQIRLRQEASTVSTDNPTMDDLNGLPYLDAVVRETLRLYSPAPAAMRGPRKDDSIPLSKPYTDTQGVIHNELRVRKGQRIMIPISLVNRDKSIWGEDALEFKPERWTNIPHAAASVPGVWSNLMTFLGGSRACIGYRFSVVETKALLFTLVRAFEFDLAVPGKDIGLKPLSTQRPVLLTDAHNSNQMPLIVTAVSSNF